MNVTPELVKAFWAHMAQKYGTVAKAKADADEMKLISQVLGTLKVTDPVAFMSRFTTTIGRTIYIPFTIGEETDTHSLWGQIVICAHEHQHVIQAQEAGDVLFSLRYLLDPTWRATYEGSAYRVSMTLHYWLTGQQPDVAPYLKSIASYGLGAEETAFFEKYLRMSVPTIVAGGVADEAAREAIAWLEANRTTTPSA